MSKRTISRDLSSILKSNITGIIYENRNYRATKRFRLREQKKLAKDILGNPVKLKQLGIYLNINPKLLGRMVREKRVEARLIKGNYYIDIDSLEEMMWEI